MSRILRERGSTAAPARWERVSELEQVRERVRRMLDETVASPREHVDVAPSTRAQPAFGRRSTGASHRGSRDGDDRDDHHRSELG
ncbi:MAG TPA: hypothetical protein VK874_13390, partial [Gaiellaceae bacterium]|nr:hypothetical protein [Gaiellaceae bacterium]